MTTTTATALSTANAHDIAAKALLAWVNATALAIGSYYQCLSDDEKAKWKSGLSEQLASTKEAFLLASTKEAFLRAYSEFGLENEICADFSKNNAYDCIETFNSMHETRGMFDVILGYARAANLEYSKRNSEKAMPRFGGNAHKGPSHYRA